MQIIQPFPNKYFTDFKLSPEESKQKLIQTVALLALLNAANHARKSRMIQSAIDLTTGVVLWTNQEAFLHKALSENVASLSTENDRLKNLLGEFEAIGMDLAKLSEDQKQQLKEQQEKFHDLFSALLKVVREQQESSREESERLTQAVEASTSQMKTAQNLFTLAYGQLTQRCQEGDLNALQRDLKHLTELCKSALPSKEVLEVLA